MEALGNSQGFQTGIGRCHHGLLFIPMVMEAHSGAWGEAARSVWKNLATAAAQVSGEVAAAELEMGLQGLAVILHRETARSILRRCPPV